MTRKLNTILLAFLVCVGAPFYWLMLDASGGDPMRPVTIGQLRRLAMTRPGLPPIEVRYETIGRRMIVGDLLAAGSGLRPMPFMVRAFQLVLPDDRTITIDHGMSRAAAQRYRIANFDPAVQATVDRSVTKAERALMLGPSVLHSGLIAVPEWRRESSAPHPMRDEAPYAVAPGVVVIPTGDVAAGQRMIYVRLANGRELVWTGDIAAVHESWLQMRPPARLITAFVARRNRRALAGWLRTVRALKVEAPDLEIVAGHDARLPALLVKGFLHSLAPGGVRPR